MDVASGRTAAVQEMSAADLRSKAATKAAGAEVADADDVSTDGSHLF